MKPNIEPGNCVITDNSVSARKATKAGDVVVFDLDGDSRIGRIIAEQGQEVSIQRGRLIIDGNAIPTVPKERYAQVVEREGPAGSFPICPQASRLGEVCEIDRFEETLPNNARYDVLDIFRDTRLDFFPAHDLLGRQPSEGVIVPEGRFFALGDNRDNATDSRLTVEQGGWGFIPYSSIEGIVIDLD